MLCVMSSLMRTNERKIMDPPDAPDLPDISVPATDPPPIVTFFSCGKNEMEMKKKRMKKKRKKKK